MANIKAELAQFFVQKIPRMFIGAVKPCNKKNATKVVVTELKMDENLTAYFKHQDIYYAYDEKKICKAGDIVLIKELPQKKTTIITHEVLRIIFPLGDITCPITQKKVVNTKFYMPRYREDLEKIYKIYGENPNRFKYEEAPPRGWQEGKRDYSHREILPKYHDHDNDPYLADV